jgi:hypothetical protein
VVPRRDARLFASLMPTSRISFPNSACSNPPSTISLAPSHSPPTPPPYHSPSCNLLPLLIRPEAAFATSASVRSIIIEVEDEVEEAVAVAGSEADLLMSLFVPLEGTAERRREGGTGFESVLSGSLAVQAMRSFRSDANKQYGMPDRMLLVFAVLVPIALVSSTVRGEEEGGAGGKKVSMKDSVTQAEEVEEDDDDEATSAPAPSFSFLLFAPLEFASDRLILCCVVLC